MSFEQTILSLTTLLKNHYKKTYLTDNDELRHLTRRRLRLSNASQWLYNQSRCQLWLQSILGMDDSSKCWMGTTSSSVYAIKYGLQQLSNTECGLQSAIKSSVSKRTALWVDQQYSMDTSSQSSAAISFVQLWSALFWKRMWKLWNVSSNDQKRLVIDCNCIYFFKAKIQISLSFFKFNENIQFNNDLLKLNYLFESYILEKQYLITKFISESMSQGFGQGGGFNYQGQNQGWGQNQGFNTNPNQGSNTNPNQGWNNNPNQNQGFGENQGWNNNQPPNQNQGWNNNPNQSWGQNQNQGWGNNPTQGTSPNQSWGQNPTQGWNNNQNQGWNSGSTTGWGHQNFTGTTWGPTNPYNWHNPYGMSIPQISFTGGCRKCNGSGIIVRRNKQIPCRRCYRHQGFCVKCYGTGVNFMRNKPCHKCHGSGKKKHGHKHRSSSSSSDSDW